MNKFSNFDRQLICYISLISIVTSIVYFLWFFRNGYCKEQIFDGASYKLSIPGWLNRQHPTKCVVIIGRFNQSEKILSTQTTGAATH